MNMIRDRHGVWYRPHTVNGVTIRIYEPKEKK